MPIVRIQVVVSYKYILFLVESITKFADAYEGEWDECQSSEYK